jgi:hypothetical protein
MSGLNYVNTAPAKPPAGTLNDEANSAVGRLRNITDALMRIKDRLYGAEPSAADQVQTPPDACLNRTLERLHREFERTEGLIQRIESGL